MNEKDVFRQLTGVFDGVSQSIFSFKSVLIFVVSLTLAIVAGRIIAYFLRRAVTYIGMYADKSKTLQQSNRLRRYETMIIISIAIIKAALVFMALYFWWVTVHQGQQSTALIGASALFAILLGGALGRHYATFRRAVS